MNIQLETIVMPSNRGKNYVQFFYAGPGDDPIVCGADGNFCEDTLEEIRKDFLEENNDAFSKGAGDYLFQVNYEPAQIGEGGRIELPDWWNLTEVLFEPLEE